MLPPFTKPVLTILSCTSQTMTNAYPLRSPGTRDAVLEQEISHTAGYRVLMPKYDSHLETEK